MQIKTNQMKLRKSEQKKVKKAMEWLYNVENEYVANSGGQTITVILNKCIIELTLECNPDWIHPIDESLVVARFEYNAYDKERNTVIIENFESMKDLIDSCYPYDMYLTNINKN